MDLTVEEKTPLVGKAASKRRRWWKLLRDHRTNLIESLAESKERQERRRKLHTSNVGAAAFLIRDAVLGDQVENPAEGAYNPYHQDNESQVTMNQISIQCRRWCSFSILIHSLRAVTWTSVLLTFFEPPHWCRNEGCVEVFRRRGMPADSSDEVYYYPTSRILFLTLRQSQLIEAACLLVIIGVIALRIGRDGLSLHRYLRPSPVKANRCIQIVCVSSLLLGVTTEQTRAHIYARLLLFYSFLTTSQREIRVLVGMLPVRCTAH